MIIHTNLSGTAPVKKFCWIEAGYLETASQTSLSKRMRDDKYLILNNKKYNVPAYGR